MKRSGIDKSQQYKIGNNVKITTTEFDGGQEEDQLLEGGKAGSIT